MNVILLLIPLSVIIAGGSGQYEDTCTPSMRVLADDPEPLSKSSKRDSTP